MTVRSFLQRHYRRARGRLDLDWVTDDLAIGCLPRPKEIPALRAAGITGTLCLIETRPPYFDAAVRAGIAVRHVPLVDWAPPSDAQFAAALAALDELTAGSGKTLVHCRAGIGRAVLVATAHLQRRGMSLEGAIGLVRGTRRVAAPNARQIAALRRWCDPPGAS